MNSAPELGKFYTARRKGKDVVVQVLEAEQDINRNRRKWVCVNTATRRKMRLTTKQLRKEAE